MKRFYTFKHQEFVRNISTYNMQSQGYSTRAHCHTVISGNHKKVDETVPKALTETNTVCSLMAAVD